MGTAITPRGRRAGARPNGQAAGVWHAGPVLLACLLAGLAGLGSAVWLTGALDGPQTALNNDTLPFYRDASLQPRWDRWSSWRRLAPFSLVDQHKQPLDQALLDQGPTVAGFFHAGCGSVCPLSLKLLQDLQQRLAARRPQFLLLTVNPREDGPEALAAYAQQLQLPANWTLATGDPQAVHRFARQALLSNIGSALPGQPPPHADHAFLIDRQHLLRGIYDASSALDMARLAGDYLRLTAAP